MLAAWCGDVADGPGTLRRVLLPLAASLGIREREGMNELPLPVPFVEHLGDRAPGSASLDRSLLPLENPCHAHWIAERLLRPSESETLVEAVIPRGFPAYCRLLHPATLYKSGSIVSVRWGDLARQNGREAHRLMQWESISQREGGDTGRELWSAKPEMGTLPKAARQVLCEYLLPCDDSVCALVWTGSASIAGLFKSWPTFSLSHRRYLLAQLPLAAIREGFLKEATYVSPNLWWPQDKSWLVATEVDMRSTYVGGSQTLISLLLEDSALESWPAFLSDRADLSGDVLNR